MVYGLRCWNRKGAETFNTGDGVTRLAYTNFIASEAASGNSGNLVDLAGQRSVQFAMTTGPAPEHKITRVKNTIYWTRRTGYYTGYDTTVYVFLY